MITILSKLFIKKEMDEQKKRSILGMLCGIAGILLNIILFAIKLIAGSISRSIAITADAFNNLSDAGSSVSTLLGFKLASQEPDPEHPFGHGRMEYLSGLVVSGLILIMGFQLVRDSIEKIIHPEATTFSLLVVCILAVSILVKCYMAYYNHSVGKKIGSAAIAAAATDSLSDCISTGVVLISTLVCHFTGLKIDGFCGLFVGILILISGIKVAKEIVNPLLGVAPEKEFVDSIEAFVLNFDQNILGVHDLIVHDYGPGRRYISLHAEVPCEGDVLMLHDLIDNIERKLTAQYGCLATIHLDPVVTKDPRVNETREIVFKLVHDVDPVLDMHDFRMVMGSTHTNLIFDVLAPFHFRLKDQELKHTISDAVKKVYGDHYFCVISVDHAH